MKLTDQEFLEAITLNPAYAQLDIPKELGKMDAWLLTHSGRKKTQRFIVNWMNKAAEKTHVVSTPSPQPVDKSNHHRTICVCCESTGLVYTKDQDGYSFVWLCSECHNWEGRYSLMDGTKHPQTSAVAGLPRWRKVEGHTLISP